MPRPRGDLLEQCARLGLVRGAAVVEADRERLPLDVVPGDGRREALQALAPVGRLRLELEPVLADVGELVDADDPPRVVGGAAADAGDERVAAVQPAQLDPRLVRHGARRAARRRSARARRRRRAGSPPPRATRRVRASGEPSPSTRPRIRGPLRLVGIGLVAGLFSALFGVGGGIVIVPLLILLPASTGGPRGDLARGDRDHGARGDDPLRVRGQVDARPRGARRAARGGRRGRRHDGPAAGLGPRLTLAFAALLVVIAVWLLVG